MFTNLLLAIVPLLGGHRATSGFVTIVCRTARASGTFALVATVLPSLSWQALVIVLWSPCLPAIVWVRGLCSCLKKTECSAIFARFCRPSPSCFGLATLARHRACTSSQFLPATVWVWGLCAGLKRTEYSAICARFCRTQPLRFGSSCANFAQFCRKLWKACVVFRCVCVAYVSSNDDSHVAGSQFGHLAASHVSLPGGRKCITALALLFAGRILRLALCLCFGSSSYKAERLVANRAQVCVTLLTLALPPSCRS